METKPKPKGRPKGNKRTKEQTLSDTNFCANLFLKGYTFREMTRLLNERNKEMGLRYTLTFIQVHYDMTQLMIEWKRERMEHIDDYMTLQLNQLDDLHKEAYEAWEKSKTGKLRIKSRNSKKPKKAGATEGEPDYYGYDENTEETSAGNPRYLELVLEIMQRKAKLLGLDAAIKIDVGGKPLDKTNAVAYQLDKVPAHLLFELADNMQKAKFDQVKAEGEKDG